MSLAKATYVNTIIDLQ